MNTNLISIDACAEDGDEDDDIDIEANVEIDTNGNVSIYGIFSFTVCLPQIVRRLLKNHPHVHRPRYGLSVHLSLSCLSLPIVIHV